ncbi:MULTISPECIES: zinc-binding dehydrogenase [unclassified Ornithinimicrobium]|uniref:zinc-dependent alcohol dehydrogenase n=1 Tax=unclassified Ornithinimicrobium TaxID=2615080 RepID=UPI0038545388
MRALTMTDYHRMEVADVPRPSPGPGDVLLRVTATGICGSDIHGFTGENGRRHPGQVMGHETAGHVAAVGDGVDTDRFPLGAAATLNPVVLPESDLSTYAGREQHCPRKLVIGVAAERQAAFADYVVVPDRNVVLLAPSMPVHLGALVEPLAVAVHAVRLGDPAPGEPVLILGGGPIGQSLILALRMAGVDRAVVSEPDSRRRDLCRELGAQTISPTDGDVAEQAQQVAGGQVALTLDAVGMTSTLADALRATSLGGTVVLVGMASPTVTIPAYAVSTGERVIRGSFTYAAQDFADAAAWLGEHHGQAAPLVSRVVSPEQAPQAFLDLAGEQPDPGKVLVRFDDTPPGPAGAPS